jgi:hypothetical protein
VHRNDGVLIHFADAFKFYAGHLPSAAK